MAGHPADPRAEHVSDDLAMEAERCGIAVARPGLTLYYDKVDDETDGEVQVCLPVEPADAAATDAR